MRSGELSVLKEMGGETADERLTVHLGQRSNRRKNEGTRCLVLTYLMHGIKREINN